MRAIAAIVAVLLVVGSLASAQQSDTLNVRKKKQRAAHMASPAKSTPDAAAPSTSDARVGTTKSGQVVYRGKKGGYYVLTPSGRKRYVKESDVIFDSSK
ncbi:MAG: hypothetical protein KatS3mg040_0422 [Candidatus Kapaibacterium sp.]|nr:MAG: hypothetical protein KatS3mg040_0422 [Candidatus Kapabacteria bacterium]